MVLEDDYFEPTCLVDALNRHEASLCRPYPSVSDAMTALGTAELDVAVLDVSLTGEDVAIVAEWLELTSIQFLFLTAYEQHPLRDRYQWAGRRHGAKAPIPVIAITSSPIMLAADNLAGETRVKTAIIFDCEFLCIRGSQSRFWCAAIDPDPVIAQIGAVKIGLERDFPIIATFKAYVTPHDRYGARYQLDPYFTDLTGITEEQLTQEGRPLQTALDDLDRFSDGAMLWSWGKDELNMIAISCYVEGIKPSIPAPRFDNAVKLLLAAGMPVEDLARTPSNKLVDYYRVEHPELQGHDALDDARSVAYTLQHLLRSGKLHPTAFGS